MAYTPFTPIPIGSPAWGVPLNTAVQNLDNAIGPVPQDFDLTHWPFPPVNGNGGTAPTSGTVQMVRLNVHQPVTITKVGVGVTTPGVTLTAGQNFLGIYNAAGARLAVTPDQSASWLSAGYRQDNLTAPVALTPGFYWIAILANAATPPAFVRGAILTASIANPNLTAATGAFTTGPAAQTSLPLSITMASRSLSATPYWAAMG